MVSTLELTLLASGVTLTVLLVSVSLVLLSRQRSLRQSQKELNRHKHLLHEQALQQSALAGELAVSQAGRQALQNEHDMQETELRSLRAQVDALKEQYHQAEKEGEVARSSRDSANKQIEQLQQSLSKAEQSLDIERDRVAKLKDELAQEGQRATALDARGQELRQQLNEVKQQLDTQKNEYKQLSERYQSLSQEHTELGTSLARKEEHFKEQMLQLQETKEALKKEFENIANKIFEEKGKTFSQASQSSIDTLLKPFREQIEGFQKRVNEVHDASVKGSSELNAEIKKVLDIGLKMSAEANNLSSALKGDSQQRGAWGEAQLRRTLEISGLVEDAHYEVQSAFKDAQGSHKQTDYLIKLPDKKHIIIDSKVSLNAYDRAVSAETPEEAKIAMAEHVKAVRKHIDDLASKDYTNLLGMHSPSFVLMFMPIEPAYIEALKTNKDLFDYGYQKNIVLVSHTTLIPILRTVSNLWMIERSNAEAREIGEKAGDIYNQVCLVAERLNKLGGTLNTVSNHYNSTVKALAGQQGLYGKVERFNQLSAKVSKTLPALEPSHMDFEAERLALIVEAVDDEEEKV